MTYYEFIIIFAERSVGATWKRPMPNGGTRLWAGDGEIILISGAVNSAKN